MWIWLTLALAAPVDLQVQAHLMDSAGTPIDGVTTVTVELRGAGDALVHSEQFTDVSVAGGYFSGVVTLDEDEVASAQTVVYRTSDGPLGAPAAIASVPRAVVARQAAGVRTVQGAGQTCDAVGALAWDPGADALIGCGSDLVWQVMKLGGAEAPAWDVAIGASTMCAVRLASNALYCWGTSDQGQVDGGFTGTSSPRAVDLPGAVVDVSMTSYTTFGVLADGRVYSWGGQYYGERGRAGGWAPEPVDGIDDAVQIDAGEHHVCVVRAGGTVACWGRNNLGQLGQGTFGDSATVATIADLTDVVQVSAGQENTCARRSNGTVACWGRSGDRYAYDGADGPVCQTYTCFSSPREVALPGPAVDISVGREHTLIALADGTVQCWGGRDQRVCGDGRTSYDIAPVEDMSGVTAVAAGWDTSFAVTADGRSFAWGAFSQGKLGIGEVNTIQATPVQHLWPNHIGAVFSGLQNGCVAAEDDVWCWGVPGWGLAGGYAVENGKRPGFIVFPPAGE